MRARPLLLVLLLLAPGAPARAAVLRVDPAGGGFATVQAALDAAQPGDTVQVEASGGPYFEKLVFPRSGDVAAGPITLESAPGGRAVIDGTGVPGAHLIAIVDRSHVRVRGLELRNLLGARDGSAIRVEGGGTAIELVDNRIHDVRGRSAMGITVYGTRPAPLSALVIERNEIHDCEPAPSEALTVNGNVIDFVIADNEVRDVDNIGIDVIGGETDIQPDPALVPRNGIVRGNRVERARSRYGGGFAAGLYVDGARDLVLERNVVTESDLGLEVGAENPGAVARNVVVRSNLLYANDKACLVFGGYASGAGRVRDSIFTNNTCLGNDTLDTGFGELWIQYAEANQVRSNVFVAGEAGRLVRSEAGSVGNQLDHNLWFAPAGAPARFSWNGAEFVGLGAWQAGTGQDSHSLFADPRFDPATLGASFRLAADSPARNAGDPAATAAPGEQDRDGGPRLAEGRVDAGADEWSCGDGVLDGGELCDDGNAASGDGCDANCTPTGCGNGIASAGEACDDGNGETGDCCSPACQLEADGSACDDGDPCTRADGCSAGACAGRIEPEPSCRAAGGGRLRIADRSPDQRDLLVWRWLRGAATSPDAFGDPTLGSPDYALCVYREIAPDAWSLALRARAPAGGGCAGRACWKTTPSGPRYRDRNGSPDGIQTLALRGGTEGRSSIRLLGRAERLDLPALPLAPAARLAAQLHGAPGLCFGTVHTAPAQRDDAEQFSDAAD